MVAAQFSTWVDHFTNKNDRIFQATNCNFIIKQKERHWRNITATYFILTLHVAVLQWLLKKGLYLRGFSVVTFQVTMMFTIKQELSEFYILTSTIRCHPPSWILPQIMLHTKEQVLLCYHHNFADGQQFILADDFLLKWHEPNCYIVCTCTTEIHRNNTQLGLHTVVC